MAEQQSVAPAVGIISAIALPIILSIVLVFGLITKSGASASQPVDTTPGSADTANINILQASTDPQAYLTKNLHELDDLIAQVSTIQTGLTDNDTQYRTVKAGDRQTALTLATAIITELTHLKENIDTGNKVDSLTTAQALVKNIHDLNVLIPVLGAQLDVPVVIQGQSGYCGRTSAAMVVLYYHQGQVPDSFKSNVGQNEYGQLVSRNPGTNPLDDPAVLDSQTGKSGWGKVNIANRSADQMYADIRASIDGGDPVIMYTEGVYYANSNHIVVITGYDPATKGIIVNNPIMHEQGGTRKNTRTSTNGSNLITADFIFSHIQETEGYYRHSFVIRQQYWH